MAPCTALLSFLSRSSGEWASLFQQLLLQIRYVVGGDPVDQGSQRTLPSPSSQSTLPDMPGGVAPGSRRARPTRRTSSSACPWEPCSGLSPSRSQAYHEGVAGSSPPVLDRSPGHGTSDGGVRCTWQAAPGLRSLLVFDGNRPGRVDHERRISPTHTVPSCLHSLGLHPSLAQEPGGRAVRDLPPRPRGARRVSPHRSPAGPPLPCPTNEDLLHPSAGLDLTPRERRWSARASDTWCIPPL